jgi:protein-S-isoprenylcysteine O-methyltransferase Ste14
MENAVTASLENRSLLLKKAALRFGLAGPVMAAAFFLTAGTPDYWQAWAYMAVLFVPMGFVLAYLYKNEPALLERRLRLKEREPEQRAIILCSYPVFLAAFLLPGLDRRFGWSTVPAWLVLAADVIVLISYGLVFRVMLENRWLSRVVEVDPEQKVISTGPYARVRHPMYAAMIPMYLFSPLALGSLWALIPAAFIPLLLVARMFHEEKLLSHKLAEYRKYARRVKFRLIPGVW